ncbi:MAG: PhnD/SsuA/transferrin family substrate-binding protein [Kiloniellales bacterium]|nr:PhnD/SsuA/transferrin family substrate-binding protein [Kiloniellales bacterium]
MAIASLPMYDLPALRRATDAWWAGLARALTAAGLDEVPARLDRRRDQDQVWGHPDLLISQTCGYPLTHALAGRVRLVATPAYDVEGCDGPRYRSVFLVRDGDPAGSLGDLRGRRVAVNSRASQSGYNCLRHALAPLAAEVEGGPFFSEVVVTGGHGASLAALRDERADLAAVDGVTYALTARGEPAAVDGLRVLAWSAPAPALPYITRAAIGEDALAALRQGLAAAAADPDLAGARRALALKGFEVLPLEAYAAIDDMERAAIALGYPEIL